MLTRNFRLWLRPDCWPVAFEPFLEQPLMSLCATIERRLVRPSALLDRWSCSWRPQAWTPAARAAWRDPPAVHCIHTHSGSVGLAWKRRSQSARWTFARFTGRRWRRQAMLLTQFFLY